MDETEKAELDSWSDRYDSAETLQRPEIPSFYGVCIGSSAGGVQALQILFKSVPTHLNATFLVVQHISRAVPSLLPEILQRATEMEVKNGEHNEALKPDTVYVGPPDFHMLVTPDAKISLSSSELVHFVRPSVDLLFETAASCFNERAVGVVLTGSGQDGALGSKAIARLGGRLIIQSQKSAASKGMPTSAIRIDEPDYVLPLEDIGWAISRVVSDEMNTEAATIR